MFNLKDKVAVVTGASQGIGRDTAHALAEAGAKVAVAARNEEKLAELVQEINAKGGEAFAVKMDVADIEQIKSGFKSILEKFGKIDILVNNAAITRDGLAMRMKPDDWEAVLKTNLTGAHLCIQQALSTMMRARGAGWRRKCPLRASRRQKRPISSGRRMSIIAALRHSRSNS